jgi:hypothetical protein
MDMGEKETWYFIRNCLFYFQEHAAVSAVVLGLAFIPKDIDTNSMAEFLEESRFGWLLTHYVLLPILVHHAGEWARYTRDRIDEANKACKSELDTNKRRQRLSTSEKEKTIRIKKELGALFASVDTTTPRPRYKLRFERMPIGTVLAYCDTVQEDGRPTGAASTAMGWATAESAKLTPCPGSSEHLRLTIRFGPGKTEWKETEMANAKSVFVDWKDLKDGFCTVMFNSRHSASSFESATFRHRPECREVCNWWKD